MSFRCTQRGCSTVIKIKNSSISTNHEHNNLNDPTKKVVKKAKNTLKDLSTNSPGLAPLEVASTVLSTLEVEAVTQMPMIRSLQRRVRSYRNGSVPSMNFLSLEDVQFPIEISTLNNEDLLKLTIRERGITAFIFSTNNLIDKFKSTIEIFADGTFSLCPSLFSQVYTIHGNISGLIVPLFYILMSNQTEEAYLAVFRRIIDLANGQHVVSKIVTDFERGAINAFKSVFPNARTQGCFFHFNQVFIKFNYM